MTIQDLGAIGEVIGAIAVVVTLFYLSIQLRQNTRAVRLSTVQAVTEELQDMFSLLASDQGLSEIFVKAARAGDLTAAEQVRYYTFSSNLVRVWENAYLQRREGSMDDAHWNGMRRMMIDYTAMAAFDGYWADRKHWVSDEFQDFMDTQIVSVSPKQGVSVPGDY